MESRTGGVKSDQVANGQQNQHGEQGEGAPLQRPVAAGVPPVGPKRDCPSDKRGGEHGWALSPQLTSTHAEGKAPDLRGGTRRPTGTAVTRDGRTQGSHVLARRTSPAAGTQGPSDLSCPSWGGT